MIAVDMLPEVHRAVYTFCLDQPKTARQIGDALYGKQPHNWSRPKVSVAITSLVKSGHLVRTQFGMDYAYYSNKVTK